MNGNLSFRHYAEADYEAVCRFLIDLNRNERSHIHWNWARFEWMYEHPECDKSLLGSIGLWLDGARVVGAAIYDMYFGEAFCGALPEYAALYPEILDYAWGHHGLFHYKKTALRSLQSALRGFGVKQLSVT